MCVLTGHGVASEVPSAMTTQEMQELTDLKPMYEYMRGIEREFEGRTVPTMSIVVCRLLALFEMLDRVVESARGELMRDFARALRNRFHHQFDDGAFVVRDGVCDP